MTNEKVDIKVDASYNSNLGERLFERLELRERDSVIVEAEEEDSDGGSSGVFSHTQRDPQ